MVQKRVSASLDQQVYNRLREIQAEWDDPNLFVPIGKLCQTIQESDLSLRRMKRQVLEKSISRGLENIRLENQNYSDIDEARNSESDTRPKNPDVDDIESITETTKNVANQNITSLWKNTQSSQNAETDESQALTSKRKSIASDAKTSSKRTKASSWRRPVSHLNFNLSDVGGIEDSINEILELIAMPLKHPEIYSFTGLSIPRGILLHGPPGCGKTLLANALAKEMAVEFVSVSAPSLVAGMSGESEKNVRDIFEEAKSLAPCILFFDEIDAVTPKRESAQREMERRIVAQFLTCIDDLSIESTNGKPVIIIGATNRPDSLDSALRRAGRFDREICLKVPDENARAQILQVLCKNLRITDDFDFQHLGRLTSGFVGADLKALATAAGINTIKRIFKTVFQPINSDIQIIDTNEVRSTAADSIKLFLEKHQNPLTEEDMEPLRITMDDFLTALPKMQPSSKREGFATIPDVSWDNIGALQNIRNELQMAIVKPILFPELFASVGISSPSGVLLWGPPGCGKTLLAKAVANESKANFISVRGPELLNKYVGESERSLRQVFSRARASIPCVIFFDEIDALVPKREESLSEASSRVVNTLLTELDGLDDRKGIYVIAATNRPDMIDPAMLRPGRLDKPLYVDLPKAVERSEILKALTRKTPLHSSVSLPTIAQNPLLESFSGADLAALIREAAVHALTRYQKSQESGMTMDEEISVTVSDFEKAAHQMRPSVTMAERKRYLKIGLRHGLKTIEDDEIIDQ